MSSAGSSSWGGYGRSSSKKQGKPEQDYTFVSGGVCQRDLERVSEGTCM